MNVLKILLQLCCLFLIIQSVQGCENSANETSDSAELYLWSHNDYEQERPLYKAIEMGFQMIEADIHLIDGNLYVIHDHPENPEQTPQLEEMYLQPLVAIIEENKGEVLPGSNVPFYLVIDVKTEAYSTFERLSEIIEPYHSYFTRKVDGEWIEGPMRLLISGNRPNLDPDDPDRIAFIDGRIPDLGKGYPTDLYPIISDSWFSIFDWDGSGEISEDEKNLLKSYAEQARAEGKLIRFWGFNDEVNIWDTFLDAGVDVINVDDLQKMRNYLDSGT